MRYIVVYMNSAVCKTELNKDLNIECFIFEKYKALFGDATLNDS